jgi:hypothetical protein
VVLNPASGLEKAESRKQKVESRKQKEESRKYHVIARNEAILRAILSGLLRSSQ